MGVYKAIFHDYLICIRYLSDLDYPLCPIPSNLKAEDPFDFSKVLDFLALSYPCLKALNNLNIIRKDDYIINI
jgi:hypothetical protein